MLLCLTFDYVLANLLFIDFSIPGLCLITFSLFAFDLTELRTSRLERKRAKGHWNNFLLRYWCYFWDGHVIRAIFFRSFFDKTIKIHFIAIFVFENVSSNNFYELPFNTEIDILCKNIPSMAEASGGHNYLNQWVLVFSCSQHPSRLKKHVATF